MRFRKKPVVIEAELFDGSLETARAIATWAHQGLPDIANAIVRFDRGDGCLTIRTLEGDLRAIPGDWIIKGVKGEFYPCKPDIFDATYEKVQEGGPAHG